LHAQFTGTSLLEHVSQTHFPRAAGVSGILRFGLRLAYATQCHVPHFAALFDGKTDLITVPATL